jgi:NADH:ubiquinone oxidoreductase subunit 5 (subunit L)/multisubunit Na+/H+ antiporter MnhA subunit
MEDMRMRNAIMAIISILLLIAQLAAMSVVLLSGFELVEPMVFGMYSAGVLGLLAISVPIDAFVIITIALLVIEASRATRVPGRHWWSRTTKEIVPEPPIEQH